MQLGTDNTVGRKDAKQVGRVVSAERGTTTTVVCAMSADGFYVPPVFVFKRKLMNDHLMKNCPPGSVAFPSVSGWIDKDLFVRYLRHFIGWVKPSESNPVLLILMSVWRWLMPWSRHIREGVLRSTSITMMLASNHLTSG